MAARSTIAVFRISKDRLQILPIRKHISTRMSHENRPEMDYENALRIIESRKRQKRPKQASSNSENLKTLPVSSGTPDLRGTPSIVGMVEWLQRLGHSEDDISQLNIIHVAGTKGKGSTCAFTESFLRAHGRRTGFPGKTGLYTSPHLILPEERIRINSKPLSRTLLAQYFFEVYDRLPQLAVEYDPQKDPIERGPRYLQLFALLAFHVFIREKVDVAIFETHNGGEYDATNVVQKPVVTAVTTLGMDHVDMLGPTIENIAWHKAGIYKTGSVALSAPQDPTAANVLKRRGEEKGVAVEFVVNDGRLSREAPQLQPEVQKTNASVAVAAAQAFLHGKAPSESKTLTDEDILAGVEHFSWSGRFQIINEGKRTWFLDSAHNNMSVEIAAQWFAEVGAGLRGDRISLPHILIFSHINQLRDAAELLSSLGKALLAAGSGVDHVIFSTYDESEVAKTPDASSSPEILHEAWKGIDSTAKIWHEPTIQGAVALARRLAPDGMQTLITGSQHLVGPALRVLGWTPKEEELG